MGHVIRVGVMSCVRNVGVNLSVIQIGVKNEAVREKLDFSYRDASVDQRFS